MVELAPVPLKDDLLLEAYRSLARRYAALEACLAEEGVTSVDTTSWDSGRLCHSNHLSFYATWLAHSTPTPHRRCRTRRHSLPHCQPSYT